MANEAMNSNEYAIETRGLTRRFKKVTAVGGLDLSVHKGEIFGLLGPDGAGKTTTIRMLCAIMDPAEGSASWRWYRCGALPPVGGC